MIMACAIVNAAPLSFKSRLLEPTKYDPVHVPVTEFVTRLKKERADRTKDRVGKAKRKI